MATARRERELAAGARVLLVRLSAMGDVVQATGAVRALHEARPDLQLRWVVQRPFAPLVEGLPGVEVFIHDRGAGARGFLRTGRELRAWRPDVALDLQGNWKSAGLARLSGARTRVGAAGAARRERASAVLLTDLLGVGSDGAHPARQALALVRAIAPDAADLPPRLEASRGEVEAEADVLRGLGLDPGLPFRALVLADPSDPRAIRPAALAREVAASELPCVAVGGPAEREVPVPAGVSRIDHAPGELRRLVGLGALLNRAGGDVVGPDKGATHVLAAAGAPVRCLFGPTDPVRTGSPLVTALRAPAPPECAPCRSRTCRHAEGPVCMDFTSREGRPAIR